MLYQYQLQTLSRSSEVEGMAFFCMYDSHARHSLSSTCPIYGYLHASMIGNGKDTLDWRNEQPVQTLFEECSQGLNQSQRD